MKPMEEQSDQSIFEMILQSNSGEPATVLAKRSDFQLPENWHEEHQDGQLAVDVIQTENELIVVSTMAGAKTEKIEVYVHNDLLTIRGERVSPVINEMDSEYFHQEYFFGVNFRTVVLPVDVKGFGQAEYKNGILIRMPKQKPRPRFR
jgi:HSP20 family molecular chaperone IbpA